ncbi:MAG: hypothetical protein ACPIOQ_85745, partial [Promethearchaeia archaeon]
VVNSRTIALRESLRVSSHFPCSNRLILQVYSNRIDCVPSRPLTTSASGLNAHHLLLWMSTCTGA